MNETDAFSLLEQHAHLTQINSELNKGRAKLEEDRATLAGIAASLHLRTLRESLDDVSKKFGDAAASVERHLMIFKEEQDALKVKLQAVAVKEADLDEIKRKRKDAAENVKDKRAGAGMYAPRMAWAEPTI